MCLRERLVCNILTYVGNISESYRLAHKCNKFESWTLCGNIKQKWAFLVAKSKKTKSTQRLLYRCALFQKPVLIRQNKFKSCFKQHLDTFLQFDVFVPWILGKIDDLHLFGSHVWGVNVIWPSEGEMQLRCHFDSTHHVELTEHVIWLFLLFQRWLRTTRKRGK